MKFFDDKLDCACAFLAMSYDFLEFVTGFQVDDAIAIKYGYKHHAPVWEMLGQNKYA